MLVLVRQLASASEKGEAPSGALELAGLLAFGAKLAKDVEDEEQRGMTPITEWDMSAVAEAVRRGTEQLGIPPGELQKMATRIGELKDVNPSERNVRSLAAVGWSPAQLVSLAGHIIAQNERRYAFNHPLELAGLLYFAAGSGLGA